MKNDLLLCFYGLAFFSLSAYQMDINFIRKMMLTPAAISAVMLPWGQSRKPADSEVRVRKYARQLHGNFF